MGKETAFSFHCMICFEEFDNTEERYPVVLPCGHTYVCNTCGKRLDKCMECRTPLYMTFSPGTNSNTSSSSSYPLAPISHSPPHRRSAWSSARSYRNSHHHNQGSGSPNSPPPAPPIKKRLPLPKNVVLLSLIEATELVSADVRKDGETPDKKEESEHDESLPDLMVQTSGSMDSLKEKEENISLATSLSAGVAGTYAVAFQAGLDIFPSRPSSNAMDLSFSEGEDVDALVQFFHVDKRMDSQDSHATGEEEPSSPSAAAATTASPSKDLARLKFGDRIQVVSVQEGWAKLARGYGFVRADRHQIVKVGNPVDRACKLEAMLRSLSSKRKDLRMQQSQVDNRFIQLMNGLQVSLQNDEDLTVICGTAFIKGPRDISAERENQGALEEKKEVTSTADPDSGREGRYPMKPVVEPVEEEEQVHTGLMCFAPELCDDDSPTSSLSRIQETFSMSEVTNSARQLLNVSDSAAPLFPAATHPTPSALRAGAQAWRERPGNQTEDIDFRTGMSGHTALMRAKPATPHPHDFLESSVEYAPYRARTPSRNSNRKSSRQLRMSSHTGLSTPKFNLNRFFSWNCPSRDDSDANSIIQQAGSV